MPQQTNLNVSPYFDDFDSANDYHKVLFKPGYPIQARELTTLQSILQDQIEKFGQHFFKDGDKVIPGNIGYSRLYQCVQLNNSYQGVPVSAYADQLIGSKITGQSSGVTAYVDYVLFPEDSERGTLTLYVNYLGSSTQNNSTQTFSNGESLVSNQVISSGLLGNTTIQAGSPFASTISNSSASTGSSFSIDAGVYFIRGSFVTVDKETLILDQYSNTPNYRVGLFINEEIITSDSDESLNDNSQGYNNYSAPGADRLKISVSLTKKQLDDFDDTNFVELATVNNGVLKSKKIIGGSISSGNGGFRSKDISDTLARRTYAESGDYYVKPFGVTYLNSLNDNVGNSGIFNSNQFTPSGGTPSDDLGVYKISPGKAFVRGYEIDVRSPVFLDAPKPRTEKVVEGQSLFYNTGTTLKLNRVFRSPTVGLGNTYIVSLRGDRVGEDVDNDGAPGEEVGLARVYDFRLDSGAYELSNSNTNIWGISLYDVQIFTKLTLNQPITLSTPTFIKGKNSGATAFLKDSVNNVTTLTIYQVSGSFIKNESLIFDGIEDGRIITDIVKNSISDVKSLFGTTDGVIGINTFSADAIQSVSSNVETATVSQFSGGVAALTVSGPGSGYTSGTGLLTSGGSGTGATVDITVSIGAPATTSITSGGSAYGSTGTNVATTGGTGSNLTVDFTSTGGVIDSLTINTAGTGYTVGDTITITGGGGDATFTIDSVTGAISDVVVATDGAGLGYVVGDQLEITQVGGADGVATVSDINNGVSTITSSDPTFSNKVSVGNLLQYSDLSASQDPIVSKIVSINNNTVSVVGVTTVTGIVNGQLPTEDLNITDLKILKTKLSESSDNTLFTRLGKDNVSTTNLSEASITIRKVYTIDIVGQEISSTTIPTSGDNEIFLPFTSRRYSLMRSDGSTEILTSDKFTFSTDLKTIQISNLSADDVGATLITTLRKSKPKSKVKRKNRVNSVLIDKSKYSASGTGESTLNDGLQYGDYPFGTRVQDEILSLNVPDIIDIHGIFESSGIQDPSSPRMDLSSLDTFSTTTNDLLLGEILVGQTSGAVAVYVEKITDSIISFVYKNDIKFIEGETINFQESLANGIAINLESPSFEISSEFSFSTGQQKSFYNYGYVKRKSDFKEPSKKVKIYFTSAFHSSDDDGDVTTVNSYDSFDYSKEIRSIDSIPNSDIIDIRPRTSNYEVEEGKRSPLEFLGRSFSQSGNSSSNILASNETLLIDYSYFLGRIDRIFLTKGGKFQVVYGTPSEKPERPINIDDALEVATIELPPYLYNPQQASIEFLEYKRYRMSDIRSLERRIKNLEFHTALSILETNTANMYIPDSEGANRLKTGFFVDNFSSFKTQETFLGMKNSIDRTLNELRPNHFTDSIDLIDGPVVNTDPSQDLLFSRVEGNNVRKNNNILTLNYSELEWLKQPFATRSESVTPFLMNFWQGTIDLTPASDNWIDPVKIDAKIIRKEGNYAETLANAVRTLNVDPQTGFAPAIWDGWKENWTGKTRTRPDTRTSQSFSSDVFWRRRGNVRDLIEVTRTTTIQEELNLTVESGTGTNAGLQTTVVEDFEETVVGEKVVGRDIVPYMRSRNVQFASKRLKPLTRVYAFFDGVDVSKFCVPKLLEISMTSGVFEVGELVEGVMQRTGLDEDTNSTSPRISFRVAQLNHKEGPYNSPTKVFQENPYTNNTLPSTYSSTSSIMNVDTFSLSNEVQGEYFGWVGLDMVLTGRDSGAQATITNVRLLSDLSSTLIGSFFIPDPKNINYPKFETGTKNFKLINDADNDQNLSTTSAEESYIASGIIEKTQETIISVRNAKVEQKPVFDSRPIERTLSTEIVSSTQIGPTFTSDERVVRTRAWNDPLAQSFLVEEDGGIFLTKCDIFFRSIDDMDIPVTLQIRTMDTGIPTQIIVPNSEVVLDPGDINVSSDGSVATTFQFKSPIYLEGNNTDYCVCLLSNSTKYSVYISRMGETDLISDVFISNPNKQYMGSLFKSQNGSTWEPSQWEDLKYTLYRADFIESGSVDFYNPELSEGNKKIATLMPNSLSFNSRKIRVGLSREVVDTYENGNTFTQDSTNATGNLIGVASKATGDLIITNAGIGYTPSSSQFTFDDVNLTAISGNGRGASADITISNGVAIAATIFNGGSGYQIGDVLSIDTIGNASVGRNCRLSIAGIGDPNELILDNVQGEFISGSSNSIFYTNNLGNLVELDESNGGGVLVSSVNVDSDGLHVKVNHKNHGMYFEDNLVRIIGAQSDIKPTKLITPYQIGSVSSISVEDASQFSTFENVGIGTTNVGLIRIGDEIIEYTDVTGNVIGGNIVRGSIPKSYPAGTPVFKYELNGISLERINKTHDLSQVSINDPINFDSYYIKLDTSQIINDNNDDRSDNVGYPKLYANQTKSTGGYNIKASQNMPFEIITPMVENVTVNGTTLTGQVRTTTSQSLSGNEIPFIDAGFESVVLNESNYLDSPRMICSRVNENSKLNTISGNKSMNLRLFLNTTNSRVSPVVDLERVNTILTSNRVNSAIDDYSTDSRVNGIDDDPTACQYISKEISLENAADSIKIMLNAHISTNNDIRAFYAVSDTQGFEPIFQPFPGHENLDSRGQIISEEDSNGESDTIVPKTIFDGFDGQFLDFKEYTFTADSLPPFRSYRIKIIMTSSSQVHVPRMKDLRVITMI